MKIVDEPTTEVEAQLRERGIEVRSEPYDPKSRNLLSDFFRFLREPERGDTVTLWEDERGRVRYYTAERVDPQIAALQERVSELSASDTTALQPRFEQIDAKLARLDELEKKVAGIDQLHEKVQKVDELATRVQELRGLETKVAQVDQLAAAVEKLPTLETKVTELEKLPARVTRLEKSG